MRARESAENYLKTILILQKKNGEFRSIDIANELVVSKPSVSVAVKKLRKEGLVTMDTSHNLTLTEDGIEYAASILERHMVIEKFFTEVLNITEETAHCDACRLEHLISVDTFNKLKENNEKVPFAKAEKVMNSKKCASFKKENGLSGL